MSRGGKAWASRRRPCTPWVARRTRGGTAEWWPKGVKHRARAPKELPACPPAFLPPGPRVGPRHGRIGLAPAQRWEKREKTPLAARQSRHAIQPWRQQQQQQQQWQHVRAGPVGRTAGHVWPQPEPQRAGGRGRASGVGLSRWRRRGRPGVERRRGSSQFRTWSWCWWCWWCLTGDGYRHHRKIRPCLAWRSQRRRCRLVGCSLATPRLACRWRSWGNGSGAAVNLIEARRERNPVGSGA